MMDFWSVGNLNCYVKNLKLQTQWTLKQQTGNYDTKGDTLEEWLDGPTHQMEQTETPYGSGGDKTLRKIHQKLEAGGKLTQKERDYLQNHDPEAYRELVNMEREQKAYEQQLRRCKSQEEVERLRMTRINISLTRVRAVEHNPNILLSKKLEIAMTEKQRVYRIAESTREFVASGEFAKLPTRTEEAEAARDEVDTQPSATQQKNDVPQPSEGTGRPESKGEPIDVDTESPEERKVRRAKARAAYMVAQSAPQPTVSVMEIEV